MRTTVTMTSALAIGLACAVAMVGCKDNNTNNLRVAAAASLTNAFEPLAAEFTKDSGIHVDLIFSSSGTLSQQIQAGAPYDVFASASTDYLDDLVAKGEIRPESISIYAAGRLALWVGKGDAPRSLEDLLASSYQHVAIASPEHAPYGIAAKEAIERAGLWGALKGKLVYGSNVRQAMQFAESGNAEAAIISLSLAAVGNGSYNVVDKGDISEGEPAGLAQAIALVAHSKKQKQGKAFISFLHSAEGQALLAPYGLSLQSQR